MRTCVVGAGSIGSLLAAHLATVTDVVVLTRRAEHARALNSEGLRVSGRHDFTARVTAAADARDLPEFDLGNLVYGLVEEGKQVADASGVELHEDPWEMNVLATRRGSRHYPSMLEDVEARRPTEVELINGALVREAERCGVSVPLQTALYRLVKAREASYSE